MNIKAYENHRKRVHGVGEEEHLCTHCAKKCWTPKELEIHIDKWHTLKMETCLPTYKRQDFEKNKNLIESKEFSDSDYPTENDIRNITFELKS